LESGGYAQAGRIPTSSYSGYYWRSIAGGGGGGVRFHGCDTLGSVLSGRATQSLHFTPRMFPEAQALGRSSASRKP